MANSVNKQAYPAKVGAALSYDERRQTSRFPFTASTTVIEISSNIRMEGRNADLSLGGCYVDTISPFAVGATVRVAIERESRRFEALATVVYAHGSLGMGLRFTKVGVDDEIILRTWVAETGGQLLPVPSEIPARPEPAIHSASADLRDAFIDLVKLMEKRGHVTGNESLELLRNISRTHVPL